MLAKFNSTQNSEKKLQQKITPLWYDVFLQETGGIEATVS